MNKATLQFDLINKNVCDFSVIFLFNFSHKKYTAIYLRTLISNTMDYTTSFILSIIAFVISISLFFYDKYRKK